MKIAILGTRGIPNYHGGFEQFAEHLSVFLVKNGHDIYVYNSSLHPYQKQEFKGVKIVHCKDLEDRIGTIGQFIYDLNCILDLRKTKFDIVLQLGYTSSSIWHRFLPKASCIITNMDGLEWKRTKYRYWVQRFLKHAEKLAVKSSDYLISDSIGIQKYLEREYGIESNYIAYGANPFTSPNEDVLLKFNLNPYKYNMLVARLEPENNIETILDGVVASHRKEPFLVIGKHNVNKFGIYLKEKYKRNENIRFLGGIYNFEQLNNLRYFSNLYFHGHSVGGTNPSLLEAIASKALIIAHDNEFNKTILNSNAYYFKSADDISKYLTTIKKVSSREKIEMAFKDLENKYNWDLINNQYLNFFNECVAKLY